MRRLIRYDKAGIDNKMQLVRSLSHHYTM